MPTILPPARLGVILSSGNRMVEPYFRAWAPERLGIHVTRMRMGSGGGRTADDIRADALACAGLLADVEADLIDLQGTGIMMERGPDGEAALVAEIEGATGIPAYTATQAVVEALRALGVGRLIVVNPAGEAALARERAYLEAVGLTVAHGAALGLGAGSGALPPEHWIETALAHDRPDGDGIFLSGSYTTMAEAVRPAEEAIGKPVVTSIQAALWTGMRRLAPKLGASPPQPALGRLGTVY